MQKKKIDKKNENQYKSKEESSLKELVQNLKKIKMTPEAFFRACDAKYDKKVTADHFKAMMARYGVIPSRGAQARIVLILDEDMEGTITLKEFYDALEAYSCSGEEHYPLDGEDYHIPFDQRAQFKLLDIIKERGISHEDLFNQCD